jgi:hypothetical protein
LLIEFKLVALAAAVLVLLLKHTWAELYAEHPMTVVMIEFELVALAAAALVLLLKNARTILYAYSIGL